MHDRKYGHKAIKNMCKHSSRNLVLIEVDCTAAARLDDRFVTISLTPCTARSLSPERMPRSDEADSSLLFMGTASCAPFVGVSLEGKGRVPGGSCHELVMSADKRLWKRSSESGHIRFKSRSGSATPCWKSKLGSYKKSDDGMSCTTMLSSWMAT